LIRRVSSSSAPSVQQLWKDGYRVVSGPGACCLLGCGFSHHSHCRYYYSLPSALIKVRAMIKSILLCSALVVVLSAGPAMAADFRALAGLHGLPPSPLHDEVLAATEGGAACSAHGSTAGAVADIQGAIGVCVITFSLPPPSATFVVANGLPLSHVTFIEVR